jgi:hypothetical protein
MNDSNELRNVVADSPVWLDRLVDGEVSADEQRQMLLALEAQPDAWRRCALAFVEAQTWRKEFRAGGNSIDGDAKPQAVTGKWRMMSGHKTIRWRWLAMAACFVLAFSIGSATRGLWMSDTTKSTTTRSETQVATTAGSSNSVATNAAATSTASNSANINPVKSEMVKMIVPTPDGTSEQEVEVPLVEGNETDLKSMLAQQNPVLSEAALATLESTGHLVQQRRAFYPVQLQDGRQGVVPVDLVEVRDTGGWQ